MEKVIYQNDAQGTRYDLDYTIRSLNVSTRHKKVKRGHFLQKIQRIYHYIVYYLRLLNNSRRVIEGTRGNIFYKLL